MSEIYRDRNIVVGVFKDERVMDCYGSLGTEYSLLEMVKMMNEADGSNIPDGELEISFDFS